uniref:Beta-1,4-galactosyltransferase 7 n=1 Tax=Meloidogyne incognita TaxID=6306 RepID=A0A914LBF5_MELIC
MIMLEMPSNKNLNNKTKNNDSSHQLCLLFPFKNRWDLAQFTIPKIDVFLKSQLINLSKFIIINQTDNLRFNRASLLNIGALQAKEENCDYIALHDIDIVPLNPALNYSYPGIGQLFHITPGKYHPIKRYDYKSYIGGVLLITLNDFIKINGMSNNFWGWGLEDDEFFQRLREAGLSNNITRPDGLNTSRSNTFLHVHNKSDKRDYVHADYKKKRRRGRDRLSGLSNINYTLISKYQTKINQTNILIINIKLFCNFNEFPECLKKIKVG